ncbi:MAG: Holliday junction resolvase RuvX [Acidobacteriota bacterium]
MRVMGLDVGQARIGVAVSDETLLIAQAITTLKRLSWEKDLQRILKLAEEYEVGQIIVGYPLNMNGTEGRQALFVQRFVGRLRAATSLEVSLWDERLSSFSAEQILSEGSLSRKKQKLVIDKVAAAVILQSYLDRRRDAAR